MKLTEQQRQLALKVVTTSNGVFQFATTKEHYFEFAERFLTALNFEEMQKDAVPEGCYPIQPLAFDSEGILRFKENKIVSFLALGKLNELACMDFSDQDREQVAQLIGYSLSGFGTLSYVSDETYARAESKAPKQEK